MSKLIYNKVKFFGTEPELKSITQIFTEVKKANKTGDWKNLPEIYRENLCSVMINVKLIYTDFYTMVVYDTINKPNPEDILKVARKLDVAVMYDCLDSYLTIEGAIDEFRKIQESIGDKYILTPGKCLQKAVLIGKDLDQVIYDQFTEHYVYKGIRSVFIEDICDVILFEKIAKLPLQSP